LAYRQIIPTWPQKGLNDLPRLCVVRLDVGTPSSAPQLALVETQNRAPEERGVWIFRNVDRTIWRLSVVWTDPTTIARAPPAVGAVVNADTATSDEPSTTTSGDTTTTASGDAATATTATATTTATSGLR
jgi:hypothetical protein